MIRRLMVPIAAAMVMMGAGTAAFAQGFPAPLPGQSAAPAGASPFPPVNGVPSASVGAPPQASFPANGAAPLGGGGGAFSAAPPTQAGGGAADQCMKAFMPLREDAEKKGKMIKAASDRHAAPDEACKLITAFGAAETKMINYISANASKCGIPPQISEQMKAGHKNTEAMRAKVCQVAGPRVFICSATWQTFARVDSVPL